jgi:hypothetical protein
VGEAVLGAQIDPEGQQTSYYVEYGTSEAYGSRMPAMRCYEWAGGGECSSTTSGCELVSVNEEGEALRCGATIGHGEISYGGGAYTAVSSDGSKIDPCATRGCA